MVSFLNLSVNFFAQIVHISLIYQPPKRNSEMFTFSFLCPEITSDLILLLTFLFLMELQVQLFDELIQ